MLFPQIQSPPAVHPDEALRSDWSHAGLKGLIPSVLHYSLLGYNFFIPDAVGKDSFSSFFPYFWLSAVNFAAFFQAREVHLHLRCAMGGLGVFCSPLFCGAGLTGMNVSREKSEELKTKEHALNAARQLQQQPGLWGCPSHSSTTAHP